MSGRYEVLVFYYPLVGQKLMHGVWVPTTKVQELPNGAAYAELKGNVSVTVDSDGWRKLF